MWIRSQDKEHLVNTNAIVLRYYEKEEYSCTLQTEYKDAPFMPIYLGNYTTEEKAMKVLDMIQRKINRKKFNKVFQMPQDNEVD